MLRAVFFDLGGTLISTAPVPEIFRRILEDLGLERSAEEIEDARRIVEKQFDIEEATRLKDEFYPMWNMRILRRMEIRENARSLAETIAKQWWQYSDVKLYEDAEETLDTLKKRGVKVGN